MKKVLPLILPFLVSSIPIFSQVTEQLDSIVWSQNVQNPDTWVPFTKEYLTFNENGQMILSESFNYDTIDNVWMPQGRRTHFYNDMGDEIAIVTTSLNESVWDTNYRYLYFYDAHRNDTLYLQENWNTEQNSWINNFKVRYDYDDQNRLYAFSNILWNKDNAAWDSTMKGHIFYNEQGKDTLAQYHFWDVNAWKFASLERKFYDENGNDTLMLRYGQGFDVSIITGKVVKEFNESGLTSSEKVYSYDANVWNPVYQKEYEWTELGNLAEIRHHEWVELSQEMILRAKEFHYYSAVNVVSQNHADLNAPAVYPNPAHEFLMIRNMDQGRIELFDLNGVRVLDQKITSGTVSVGKLSRGLYIYKITRGATVIAGKIRIE